VALLILSPLLLFVAALIKLTSPGPVLFTHMREGREGRVFRCWKFRTMVHGAHAEQRELYRNNALDGPQFKLDRDHRITRLGHRLRVTNIDELPQLINVMLGHMSLIGPRPSPFRENQICIPWRQARLSVRPGITGLWQLCRQERDAGDFHQWIYYDMLYVRHMSAWLDLKILAATVLTLAGRWSVPLSWMIPRRKLHEECEASSHVSWLPDLREARTSDPLTAATLPLTG
jgi:lipopolysaccharide/colanic/teichoic acid biosynthesis glycosyltransferase